MSMGDGGSWRVAVGGPPVGWGGRSNRRQRVEAHKPRALYPSLPPTPQSQLYLCYREALLSSCIYSQISPNFIHSCSSFGVESWRGINKIWKLSYCELPFEPDVFLWVSSCNLFMILSIQFNTLLKAYFQNDLAFSRKIKKGTYCNCWS